MSSEDSATSDKKSKGIAQTNEGAMAFQMIDSVSGGDLRALDYKQATL